MNQQQQQPEARTPEAQGTHRDSLIVNAAKYTSTLFAGVAFLHLVTGGGTIHTNEATFEGTSGSFLDMTSEYSIVIADGQKIVDGYARDDLATGNDPFSNIVGVVERQIEWSPDGAYRMDAYDDPEIGFYILLTEESNGRQKPVNFANIKITTPKPEPCFIEVVNNSMTPANWCTRQNDQSFRGALSIQTNSGSPIPGTNNGTIGEKAKRAADIAISNSHCELVTWLGVQDIQTVIVGSASVTVSPEAIYDGAKASVMMLLRSQIAEQYGLPITDAKGMPFLMTADQISLVRDAVRSTGKKHVELTHGEFQSALQTLLTQKTPNNPGINPGDSYAVEILNANSTDADIRLPSQDPPLTLENAANSAWNFTCLPANGSQAADALARRVEKRNTLGQLANMPPFATAAGLGARFDEEIGRAKIETFKHVVLNGRERNK